MSCLCVFKSKGYNSVNTPRGERDRSSRNGFSCWGELTPFPSLTPPPPSSTPQSFGVLQRGHMHAGVLVRAIGATSRMGLAVWMPWPPLLLSGTPQSLLPFYSLLRFQFQWRLTVAGVVFKIFFSTEISRRNREIQEIQSTKLETVCLESTKNYSVELRKRTSGTTTTYCLSHCDFT